MTEKFNEIHGVVDRLLQETGEYSPVELLLSEGRLSYADYEAWRCGQAATLAELLAGNPVRIIALLTEAGRYVASLGLVAEHRKFYSWGNQAGKVLCLSIDPAFEALCSVHYRRAGNELQLDLFMDNTANLLVNGIVEALSSRQLTEAARLIGRLLEADPSHPRLAALETLCHAAQRLPEPVSDYLVESEYFEGYLLPLATETLGIKARDFVVPFWRRLGEAARGQAFNSDRSSLHASYALGCAGDWSGVKVAILKEARWQDFPVLRCRLAEAEFYLREQKTALALWCNLCWDFPVQAEQLLVSVPSKSLQSAWQRYRELEVEPALSVPFFPAWLLLERADTREALLPEKVADHQEAGQAYCALHELLTTGVVLSERTVLLRNKLNQAHPGLFAIYKRRIMEVVC